MRHIWSLTILAGLVCTSLALQAVPKFVVDLDQPASTRWNGAVKTIVDAHGWENSFGPVLDLYLQVFDVLVPKETQHRLAAKLNASNADFYLEGLGIMAQLHEHGCALCNDTSLMFTFAYYYEIAHASELKAKIPSAMRRSCCGILSLPADKSLDIIHGRNMDESPHQGRNMTLNVNVTRGGKHLYSIVDWTWIIGAATTSRVGGVTLEMNWNNDGPDTPMAEIIDRILNPSTKGILQIFRSISEKEMDFDQAVSYIASSQFAAPFYNIVSGTKRRGAILTLEFNATNNIVEYLTDESPVTFMVQTNYDRWKPDTGLLRRTAAENALTAVGRDRSGTELGVWMALSTYPVHNAQTLFTAILSVAKEPEAFVRTAMLPETYV